MHVFGSEESPFVEVEEVLLGQYIASAQVSLQQWNRLIQNGLFIFMFEPPEIECDTAGEKSSLDEEREREENENPKATMLEVRDSCPRDANERILGLLFNISSMPTRCLP